jgi:hypothetical protein
MTDISNYQDSAPVTFDIYDLSAEPPLRMAAAKGVNELG